MENVQLKALRVRLESVAKKNIGKIVYSLFLTSILQSIFCYFLVFPLVKTAKNAGAGDMLFFLIFFAFSTICLLFQFGLQTMLLRMTRSEFVTLGFLFFGIKKPRLSLPVILPMAALLTFFLALTRFFWFRFAIFYFPAPKVDEDVFNLEIWKYAFFACFFAVLSILFVVLPFALTFLRRTDKPHNSALDSFLFSIKTLFPKKIGKLVLLALSSSWKRLLISFATLFIALGSAQSSKIVSMLFDFVYIINMMTAVAKISLSSPILYDSLTNKNNTGRILFLEA